MLSLFLYIYYTHTKATKANAKALIDMQMMQMATRFEKILNQHEALARAISHTFLDYEDIKASQRKNIYKEILQNAFIENPNYLGVWSILERSYFDSAYHKTFGAEQSVIHEFSGKIDATDKLLFSTGDDQESIYYKAKMSLEEAISEPLFLTYDARVADEFITQICVPIINDGKFVGLVGLDLLLSQLQKELKNQTYFPDAYSFVLSGNGTYVAHLNASLIGKKLSYINPKLNENFNVSNLIRNGEKFGTFYYNEELKKEVYISYYPITIGNTKTPWAVGIEVPLQQFAGNKTNVVLVTALICILGILLLSLVALFIGQSISRSMLDITSVLEKLRQGDIGGLHKVEVEEKGEKENEIRKIKKTINQLIDSFIRTSEFARRIGKGELNIEQEILQQRDMLGNSLLEMHRNLLQAREEEKKRREEDAKRNWATRGLAELGEILRQSRGDIHEFSDNIIRNLTKYLHANQGGIFIINDADEHDVFIELLASYAYDKKRLLQRKIKPGRGLVGRCIQEKATVFMREIPENYITITSGLGESSPRNLLLIPLIFDDLVYGVIELASFRIFENYEIEFVEKFGESVAAAISNIKINIRTARLLEESNIKSKELAIQEKEMRQNVLDLQATQEESARKEIEMTGILKAIASTSTIIQYAPDRKIIEINGANIAGGSYYKLDMVGRYHHDYALESLENPKEYEQFWRDLLAGKSRDRIAYFEQNEIQQWVSERYTPVKDEHGKVYKVITIGNDITESKILENRLLEQRNDLLSSEEKLRQNLEELQATQDEIIRRNNEIESLNRAVDRSLMRAEITKEGLIIDINEKFSYSLAYAIDDLLNRQYISIVSEEEKPKYNKIWKAVKQGKSYKGSLRYVSKNNEIKWLLLSYIPEFEKDRNVRKVFILGYDVTESKKLEIEVSKQAQELQEQEKELRQTLEMFQATQEDMALQAAQNTSLVEAISSSSLVVEVDPYGIVVKANSEFLHILDVKEEKILGHLFYDFNRSFVSKEAFSAFLAKLAKGTIEKRESRLEYKDKEIWLHETYSPILDQNRNVNKILIISFDISSRKKQEEQLKLQTENLLAAEEELRQNIEELQATQEEIIKKNEEIKALNIAVDKALMRAEISPEGIIEDVNYKFAEALAYKPEELIRKHWQVFIHEDEKLRHIEIWKNLNKGKAFQGEIKVKTEKDTEKWFLLTYTPEPDEYTLASKVFLLGYDISESKKLEMEVRNQAKDLQEQEEDLRQTLEEFMASQEEMMRQSSESMSVIRAMEKSLYVCQFDLDGKLITANEKFRDLFAENEADLTGTHFDKLYEKSEREQNFSEILDSLKKKETCTVMTRFKKDGNSFVLKENFHPIFGFQENLEKIINIAIPE